MSCTFGTRTWQKLKLKPISKAKSCSGLKPTCSPLNADQLDAKRSVKCAGESETSWRAIALTSASATSSTAGYFERISASSSTPAPVKRFSFDLRSDLTGGIAVDSVMDDAVAMGLDLGKVKEMFTA